VTIEKERTNGGSGSPRLALGLLMFLLGGCGLAYEYTLSKFASDLLGNSVQQWATMIATMLFAMGVGADLQKRTPDEKLADRLMSTQVWLALAGGFGPLLMVHSFALLPHFYILIQYGLALAVGTLIGYEIPLVMRINESAAPEMKSNLSQVLKMDYIGALVGALLWTFILVRYLSIERISFILALVTIASAGVCYFLYHRQLHSPRRRIAEVAVGLVIVIAGLIFGRGLSLKAEQFLYRDPVVTSITTPYQHIVLTKDRHHKVRCYINGHLQFDETDEHIYHENLVHPVMHVAPRQEKVLILGGGDGLALREVLKYPAVKEVTLVDLDPAITTLASEDPDLVRLNHGSMLDPKLRRNTVDGVYAGESFTLEEPDQYYPFEKETRPIATLRVINLDAAKFVTSAGRDYDVVIIDFPDPNSPDLAKLYSRPFYEHLKSVLRPGAVIVQQCGSPLQAKEAFLCIGRTIAAAGFKAVPYHDNVPSFGEWGWWIGSLAADDKAVRGGLAGIPEITVPTRYLTPELVAASLVFGKGQLESSHKDITSLTEPTVYHYHLQGWQSSLNP
jgi:spermidine synthase